MFSDTLKITCQFFGNYSLRSPVIIVCVRQEPNKSVIHKIEGYIESMKYMLVELKHFLKPTVMSDVQSLVLLENYEPNVRNKVDITYK